MSFDERTCWENATWSRRQVARSGDAFHSFFRELLTGSQSRAFFFVSCLKRACRSSGRSEQCADGVPHLLRRVGRHEATERRVCVA